jgi:uncharacterized membrane protein YqgA involved in biofilm formation
MVDNIASLGGVAISSIHGFVYVCTIFSALSLIVAPVIYWFCARIINFSRQKSLHLSLTIPGGLLLPLIGERLFPADRISIGRRLLVSPEAAVLLALTVYIVARSDVAPPPSDLHVDRVVLLATTTYLVAPLKWFVIAL